MKLVRRSHSRWRRAVREVGKKAYSEIDGCFGRLRDEGRRLESLVMALDSGVRSPC